MIARIKGRGSTRAGGGGKRSARGQTRAAGSARAIRAREIRARGRDARDVDAVKLVKLTVDDARS